MLYTVFRVKSGCKIGGVVFSGGLGFTEHRRTCVAELVHPTHAKLISFLTSSSVHTVSL